MEPRVGEFLNAAALHQSQNESEIFQVLMRVIFISFSKRFHFLKCIQAITKFINETVGKISPINVFRTISFQYKLEFNTVVLYLMMGYNKRIFR